MVSGKETKKKTMGRRKIEIKKIENKTSLAVTFSKRRGGLFNKASELSILCGAQVAIVVQSPAGKIYSFGEDALIHSFLTREAPPPTADYRQIMARRAYEEAVLKLEIEKRRMGPCWWNGNYEGLELHELEEYLEALNGLAENVSKRAEELMKLHDNNFALVPLDQEFSSSSASTSYGPVDDNFNFTDNVISKIVGDQKEMDMEELMANFGPASSSASYDGHYDDLFDFIDFN